MSIAAEPRPRLTIAEYLAAEARAPTKNILWDGEVFSVEAMAGGTLAHNTICGNVIGALHAALRGTHCRVVTSDQKLWVPLREGFVYPDAAVLCGRVERYLGTTDVVTNPTLLVEVLSDGTEKFDRGDKFEGYRSIPSLRHYVMLSSRHVMVEHYARAEDEGWLLHPYRAGETLRAQDLGIELEVDELYRMAFDAE